MNQMHLLISLHFSGAQALIAEDFGRVCFAGYFLLRSMPLFEDAILTVKFEGFPSISQLLLTLVLVSNSVSA